MSSIQSLWWIIPSCVVLCKWWEVKQLLTVSSQFNRSVSCISHPMNILATWWQVEVDYVLDTWALTLVIIQHPTWCRVYQDYMTRIL